MEKQGATSYTLINKGGIASATYKRLKEGESVSTNALDALCKLLNCTLSDVAEYIPDELGEEQSE